jgi:hypothetical protein
MSLATSSSLVVPPITTSSSHQNSSLTTSSSLVVPTEAIYCTIKCEKCEKNWSYYFSRGKNVCGVCSRSDKERTQLRKDKAKKDELRNLIIEQHNLTVEAEKGDGKLICSKMYMMKTPTLIDGFINVYPNYKDGSRKDGLGMPSLSPKSIGPIDHKQPDLPVCLNLENFHQGNKVFPEEIEGKDITHKFFKTQKEMYNDPVPHRHKTKGKGNVPVFSVWIDKNKKLHKLTYIESRQLYCGYYERAVKNDANYLKLLDLLKNGYNLNIVGYDGYPVTDDIEFYYLDSSRPFGHELVLYTLLKYSLENREDYPWVKYKTLEF